MTNLMLNYGMKSLNTMSHSENFKNWVSWRLRILNILFRYRSLLICRTILFCTKTIPIPLMRIQNLVFILKFQKIKIELFDINGRNIKTIANKNFDCGIHSVQFHSFDLPSGVNLYQLKTLEFNFFGKLTLVK